MLYIQPHLGLGDAIVCNGLVRVLADRFDLVIWATRWRNRQSVTWMWSDVENVKVIGVGNDAEAWMWAQRFEEGKTRVLRLGMHGGSLDMLHWGEQMYRQAGVEWGLRWEGFRLPEREGTPTPLCSIVPFVHDDPKRGFKIDVKRLPETWAHVTPTGPTIWDHLHWLQTTPEVHVIDSCFLCLADSVPTCGRLVLHKYATRAKGGYPPTLRKRWEVIE